MTVQGIQLDVLQTIAEIQEITSSEEVEDAQIAEEIDLDISIVRSALVALAKSGYVELEKGETLSGIAYNTFLTSQGKIALRESRSLMSDEVMGFSVT
jgi:Mn-dependent DtxR family transcriptional regulator